MINRVGEFEPGSRIGKDPWPTTFIKKIKDKTLPGLVKTPGCRRGALVAVSEVQGAMPQAVDPAPDDTPTYRVTARSGLNLRGGPGNSYDVIKVLPFEADVTIGQEKGDWAEVDVEGDRGVDAWVFASYLKPIE